MMVAITLHAARIQMQNYFGPHQEYRIEAVPVRYEYIRLPLPVTLFLLWHTVSVLCEKIEDLEEYNKKDRLIFICPPILHSHG
jgi:hypothetical protein